MIVAFRSTPPSFSTVPSEHILRPCNLSTSHLQAIPNSFPCHTSAKSARNSFRCHTYKFALPQVLSLPHIQKTRGVPFGVRRSCRRFHGRQLSAQDQPCQRGATTSPLFSHFTN